MMLLWRYEIAILRLHEDINDDNDDDEAEAGYSDNDQARGN